MKNEIKLGTTEKGSLAVNMQQVKNLRSVLQLKRFPHIGSGRIVEGGWPKTTCHYKPAE
jgi:hypothetical protein